MGQFNPTKRNTAALSLGLITAPFLWVLGRYCYDELQWRLLEHRANQLPTTENTSNGGVSLTIHR